MIVDREQIVRVRACRKTVAGSAGAGRDTPGSC